MHISRILKCRILWHWKSSHRIPVAVCDRTPSGRCHKTILSSYGPAAGHRYSGALSHRLVLIAGQNPLPAPFIVFPERSWHGPLKPFSNILNGPGDLMDEMVLVHNDLFVWGENPGQFHIGKPHITYKELYFQPFALRYSPPVISQMALHTIRKNIRNPVLFGIYEDTLIFFGKGIALEFINGDSFRQYVYRSIVDSIQKPANGWNRNPGKEGNLF